jgi:hypothetical protein
VTTLERQEARPVHAVFVSSTISNFENARRELNERVIPTVSQAPGFVAGYWLAPVDGRGNAVVIFESQEAAQAAAERLDPPRDVTIDTVEVREVVGHA